MPLLSTLRRLPPVAIAVAAGSACGTPANLDCGPGTRLRDGVCQLQFELDGGPIQPTLDGSVPAPTSTDDPDFPVTLLEESTGRCPNGLPGPALVEVDGPAGVMCVDSTEVTQAQYEEFMLANPPSTSGVVSCMQNSLLPGGPHVNRNVDCPISQPYDPVQTPNMPVVCVDWCDAEAYCAWAGKRLCGGPNGAPMTTSDRLAAGASLQEIAEDVTFSELAYVCSAGGTQQYPYGDAPDERRCSKPTMVDVATAGCEGPADVHDLTDNVSEWSAICLEDRSCAAIGGNAISVFAYGVEVGSRCGYADLYPLESGRAFLQTGIRCCAEVE